MIRTYAAYQLDKDGAIGIPEAGEY
ncbi:hypothetical protein MESS4_430116 [Mesorhizobium sp. STM 4661]|nr:hypothetical protein MESS4_430116 [Mesorhizobium sp. STM 4661]